MKKIILSLLVALTTTTVSAMQIFIQPEGESRFSIEVEPSDSFENLKAKIQDRTGIDPSRQTLIFDTKVLADNKTLADYNIQKESTINLQVSATTHNSHYAFSMPAYDVEVTTELWYKLEEDADNSALAAKTNVFLKRTIKTGVWNSFCAPFAIADPASVFGEDVQVKQLTNATLNGGTLTLTFSDAASIAAATPYLIKLKDGASDVNLEADGKEFAGVTQNYTPVNVEFNNISFKPTLVPAAISDQSTEANKTILFLNAAGALTWPKSAGTIKAFRAYFDLNGTAGAREFVLDLGDGETTSIQLVENTDLTNGTNIYDLQGRKVAQPTKGLYIQDGKKIIIK